MDAQNERMQVLERIERGEISVDEGVNLIEILSEKKGPAPVSSFKEDELPENNETPVQQAQQELARPENNPGDIPSSTSSSYSSSTYPAGLPPDGKKWKGFWLVPLWIGVALTGLGGWFMYLAVASSGFGFWFICAALLFALGVIVTTLAWQSQFSPWLHLRVLQGPGEYPERISFSFPLPIRPASWFLQNFGPYIHGLDRPSVDEILSSIDHVTSSENPVFIQVDEGEQGRKVEIYIG